MSHQNLGVSVEQKHTNIGFFGVLLIVFVVLKLTGNIDWSWFLVLSPLWGPLAAGVLLILCVIIAAFGFKFWKWFEKIWDRGL